MRGARGPWEEVPHGNGLAVRTFDDPNAPVKTFSNGVPIFYHNPQVVHVGQVDWVARMANINSPVNGWMRIDGANGPLLSAANTGCNSTT